MREKTYRVALGGILSALAAVFMLMGGIFPFAQYAGPCAASACVMIFLAESGRKWALIMYAAVSGVSLLLSNDLEGVLLFVCFVGWYPVLKVFLEKKLKGLPLVAAKLGCCALCVGLMYWVLLRVVAMPALVEEFAEYTKFTTALIIVMGLVAFLLVDRVLSSLTVAYLVRFRSRLVKGG